MFEQVEMVVDLVRYLLAQGIYSKPKNIVVLTMYLGQLTKLRTALTGLTTVVVDERDEAALAVVDERDETTPATTDAKTRLAPALVEQSIATQVRYNSLVDKRCVLMVH